MNTSKSAKENIDCPEAIFRAMAATLMLILITGCANRTPIDHAAESATAAKLAIDALFCNKFSDKINETDTFAKQRVSAFFSVVRFESLDAEFVEARSQHAAIAGAGAMADMFSFANEYGMTCLRQYSYCSKAADARCINPFRQIRRNVLRARRLAPPERLTLHTDENVVHVT